MATKKSAKTQDLNTIWEFIDSKGSFQLNNPGQFSRLYFPLANESGMLANITPKLKGSSQIGQDAFLTLPVSVEDLHNSKASRNFWVVTESGKIWSATGVSKNKRDYKELVSMQGGLLWHQITRKNQTLGLSAQIKNFIPASDDQVEIMCVTIQNFSKNDIKFRSIGAVPMYARSADNLRDHRHVTSLLHRIQLDKNGVLVTPTMTFDERGHNINELTYAVLGVDEKGVSPRKFYPTVECFIGEGGSFEYPKALFESASAPTVNQKFFQGKEAMGAIEFNPKTLKPGQSTSFIILMGIASDNSKLRKWIQNYGSLIKVENALKHNIEHWEAKSNQVRFTTHDPVLDNWLKWVGMQPTFRKIFGNSFLPDFDYGRGGRGWRDLWQDCLALLLTFPDETKTMLLHNFGGIRIDGSNATIISTEGYKFIADRNQITRVWMDHGVWPLITTELYIHESGDIAFLLKKAPYFRDLQLSRARRKDASWNESYGTNLKTEADKIYKGTLIEHILVQHLVQFYNVGPHNQIRLENADWNDGLDMAPDKGESVAFTCFYAGNLLKITSLLSYLSAIENIDTLEVFEELFILLDSLKKPCLQYSKIDYKLETLERYFKAVQPRISGDTREVKISDLIHDLKSKSEWMMNHIRKTEWLTSKTGYSFYNGYYDNKARRVEGDHKLGLRMALTSQTFSIMSGVASDAQVSEIVGTVDKYLRDAKLGGVRLNTDFKEIQPDLGRAFSFAYGEKENGAFFNHMQVMYAFALYHRGFVKEGYRVLSGIHRMSINTQSSKIYPGLPEYFNSEGRGLYHYLTGSASWLITTYLTQVYGIMGHLGDLLIAPKLVKEQFQYSDTLEVNTIFAHKKLKITFSNPNRLSFGKYEILETRLNGNLIDSDLTATDAVLIHRASLEEQVSTKEQTISLIIGPKSNSISDENISGMSFVQKIRKTNSQKKNNYKEKNLSELPDFTNFTFKHI